MFITYFLVATCLVGVFAEHSQQELECVQEVGIPVETLEKFTPFSLIAEDKTDFQKLAECFWTKMNIYDGNKVNVEVLKDVAAKYIRRTTPDIDQATIDHFLAEADTCSNSVADEDNKGLLAIKFHNCVVNGLAKYQSQSKQ